MRNLGPYRLLEVLGAGGMAVVYRARHQDDRVARGQGGDVAVKALLGRHQQEPALQERLRCEAQTLMDLNHPAIAKGVEILQTPDGPALVMRLVEGTPFSDLPRTWEKLRPHAEQLLSALAHAHGLGFIHRDIKPANVLVGRAGVQVLDFGWPGNRGMAAYMAPEQVEGHEAHHLSDLYATGMMLYEVLSGGLPWSEEAWENPLALAEVKRRPVPSLGLRREDLPRAVVETVDRAVHPDPSMRPSSAMGMWVALSGGGHVLGPEFSDLTPAVMPPGIPVTYSAIWRGRRVHAFRTRLVGISEMYTPLLEVTRHPALVRVLAVDDGVVVTERAEGWRLDRLLGQVRLPPGVVAAVLQSVLEAMAELPDNCAEWVLPVDVVLCQEGGVKVRPYDDGAVRWNPHTVLWGSEQRFRAIRDLADNGTGPLTLLARMGRSLATGRSLDDPGGSIDPALGRFLDSVEGADSWDAALRHC